MKRRTYLGKWKSPKAERRFRAMEDELAAERWPEPPTSVDIETHLGPTHAHHWPGDGDPIVLIHGFGSTSLMWADCVQLLHGRDLYAIENIGDVGRSRQLVAAKDAADLADWLDEVLTGLGLTQVHLVGGSYGGFLALNLAIRRPEPVRSVTLVEPVGLAPFRMTRFLLWGLPILPASWLPGPLRRAAGRALRMPAVNDKPTMRMGVHGHLHFQHRLVPPYPFTDEQLRTTTVPVLVLLGGRSPIHDSALAKGRAEELLPEVTVEIVADGGHALPLTHAEPVVERTQDFVRRHSAERPAPEAPGLPITRAKAGDAVTRIVQVDTGEKEAIQ